MCWIGDKKATYGEYIYWKQSEIPLLKIEEPPFLQTSQLTGIIAVTEPVHAPQYKALV